eukprot:332030-Alexandrium_andersonii.AAC.1
MHCSGDTESLAHPLRSRLMDRKRVQSRNRTAQRQADTRSEERSKQGSLDTVGAAVSGMPKQ